jgi:hypothetical protein
LDRFYFGSHFITSLLNITQKQIKEKALNYELQWPHMGA